MKYDIAKLTAAIAAASLLIGTSAARAADNDKSTGQQSSDQQSQQSGAATDQNQSQSGAQSQTGAQIGDASGAISQAASDPQSFVKEAYQENLAEIQLGQLAQQKAEKQDVKEFGQHLITGHQALNDKLKQLADQKNIQVSAQLDARHQRMVDECASLSGADFDKKFLSQQIRAHRKAIGLFQQAASKNSDAEVKDFAQNNLPALRQHLQMAQQHSAASEAAGAQQPGTQQQDSQQQQQGQQQGQQGQQQQDQSQPQQQPPAPKQP